mmetsp:Transcript_12994/g.22556  ORF Transcript_12994/g.22556 Transcript_12994/m.22556 type:complete len:85 (+) Transcript_12994:72-326(+)
MFALKPAVLTLLLVSLRLANAGCCDCAKLEGSNCKDGVSKHRRQRSFCTEQTSEGACLSAGGRSWVGSGTCRWTCPSEVEKEDL